MTHDPLITQALLGSARMTALPGAPTPELAEIWPTLDSLNPAASLLQALALSRALQVAGTRPVALPDEAMAACPAETRPFLPPAMVDAGLRLLGGDFAELIDEWLALGTAAGAVVPPRSLPAVLQFATRNQEHRAAVRKLCGERGLWLAKQRGEFSWLLEDAPVDESAWDEGQPTERLAWLRQLRRSDPARARAAVAAQWAGEEPAMRERILRVIAAAPEADDVEFLEKECLKDRRQEVREQALAALLQVPDSPLLQRSLERVVALVRVERKLLRRYLVVTPPAEFQPAWAADGIKEKPPQGTGEKAWWLRQLVALVPLAAWPERVGITARELFSLPIDGDWAEPLQLGWMDAARRLPGLALPAEFVPWLAGLEPWPKAALHRSQVIGQLMETLPVANRYPILEAIHGRTAPELLLDLLCRCPAAPASGTAEKCLATIRSAVRKSPSALTRPQARALARCVPLPDVERELQSLATLPELTSAAEEFAATLDFRRLIYASSILTPNERE
jgi:hypothetical protein